MKRIQTFNYLICVLAKSQAKHLDLQHLFDQFGMYGREVTAWCKKHCPNAV